MAGETSRPKYDEFGNYVGPELPSDESESEEYELESEEEEEEQGLPGPAKVTDAMTDEAEAVAIAKVAAEAQAVVPHEEKQLYPSAEDIYGDAEVLVQEEDTQPITQMIIEPTKLNRFDLVEVIPPTTEFQFEFLAGLMKSPNLLRHVCVMGQLHHGKTSIVDLMVKQTHTFHRKIGRVTDESGNIHPAAVAGPDRSTLRSRKAEARTRELRYTDSRMDEQERGISVKATPLSLVLPDSRGKSWGINVFDTPGHVNFLDEVTAAVRLCDGAVLLVDALEGPGMVTRKCIEAALREGLDMVLMISCLDRLILELRLPPQDAFHKIRYIIKEVNEIVATAAKSMGLAKEPTLFNPQKNNVVFSSGRYDIIFTLQSFAKIYVEQKLDRSKEDKRKPSFSYTDFAKFLWGDIWFNPSTRRFQKQKPPEDMFDEDEGPQRSFVQFILIPLYKLVSHAVAEEKPTLEPTLAELGIVLDPECYLLDTRSLLKQICGYFFQDTSSLVDSIIEHVRSPVSAAEQKVLKAYTGNQSAGIVEGMRRCDAAARLMVMTTKNYHRPDGNSFDVFGRVMSGTIHKGEMVKVLGENYSLDDDEDMLVREVSHLWIYESRYRVEVQSVSAGNWVLIGGVDPSVKKTATITSLALPRGDENQQDEVEIFARLQFPTAAVIRVACEPLNPLELPKMIEGLRKIDRSYPLLKTKIEDSGEHVITGTGELYLDCALHDLRKLYGDLEIKISDPVVQICETVAESSAMKAFADTPNKKNRITMISEPLERGIADDIEKGILGKDISAAQRLTEKYNWDKLAARSVMAFSSDKGTSLMLNDIIPASGSGIVERKQLESVRDFIVHGFQWATREGPLVEEPVRNVKMKLIDLSLATEPIHRNGGQIIPTARRVAYSSLLLATPRLMEPMLFAEIQCPADCVPSILNVLARRRGHLSKDIANPGTPLETLYAYLPAIDSFGFESDIRSHTSGQAFVQTMFDRWELLPGDPLDSSIMLRPLEPAPVPHLAREFLLKTRRRKGLSADVSLQKFFDEAMLLELAKNNAFET